MRWKNLVGVLAALGMTRAAVAIDITSYGAIPNDGKDDSAAINAAINAAGSGATVTVPAGTFDLAGSINGKSNISLLGQGATSILRYTTQATGNMLTLDGMSNVNVGSLVLDGNSNSKLGQGISASSGSGLNLHDLTIKNLANRSGFGPHAIIFNSSVTNSIVANNSISNIGMSSTWGAGIRVAWGSSNNQIINNTIANTGRGGILCDDNSTDLRIRNNTVTGSGTNGGDGLGIEVWGGCDRAIVEDNHIDHWLSVDSSNYLAVRRNVISDKTGAYKYCGLELVDAHDDVFTDNTVDSGQKIGISISGPNPKQYVYWGLNTIKAASTWGIQIQGETGGASRQYFYKNSFSGSLKNSPYTLYAPQGHGIRFNDDASDIVFDSNTSTLNGDEGLQVIGSNLHDLTFVNNGITSNSGSATEMDPITGLWWKNNTVSSNGSNSVPTSNGTAPPTAQNFSESGQLKINSPIQFSITGTFQHVLWDFGDGLPSNDISPLHTFTTAGTYRVTAIGWDSGGTAQMSQQLVTIGLSAPEPASLAAAALGWVVLIRRPARRAVQR